MQIQTKKIAVNGAEFNYIEQGSDDPVIFVHGSLNDFRTWAYQLEPFSKRYHVIAYSRRYHYPNIWAGDETDYSAKPHAEDLAALIKKLGLIPTHIVAHSYGAYASMFLAAQHPELIRTLVLCEPPLIPLLRGVPGGDQIAADFIDNIWKPSGQAFQHGDLEQGVRIFIDGISGNGTFDKLPKHVRDMVMDNAPGMKAQATAKDQFPDFTCEAAQKIDKPALLLRGELSHKMLHLILDELERCLPNSEMDTIPGVSHNMHAGNPQAFNETVLTFLAKH